MARKGQTKVTPAQLTAKATEYLEDCKKNNRVPLLIEFAYNLDISRDTLWKYQEIPSLADPLKKVEEAQEIALISKGLNDNKPVFPIFMLKAKHKWVEQQKVDITSGGEAVGIVMLPSK
jgi:hypothetical protein